MSNFQNVVIVGASHAGVAVADALRRASYAGSVTLIDRSTGLPMERPPLSKAFLLAADGDDEDIEEYALRCADWYQANKIQLLDGQEVVSVDVMARQLALGDGSKLGYDALVLATGATPRMLLDAGNLDAVHVLRDRDDALRLRSAIRRTKSVIIVGGGYIGLEVAASLCKSGKQIDIVQSAPRLLSRVASPPISDFFHSLHSTQGAALHVGVEIEFIAAESGRFTGVRLCDGAELQADLLIVGIGVVPNMRLAEMAGIACANGITVGPDMQTSISGIYAVGDVAFAEELAPQIGGRSIRVESVHNAQDSAARAAASIVGQSLPAWQAPRFWSEQFDVRLQSVGIVPPVGVSVRQVKRPGKREGSWSVWSYYRDRLCAVEALDDSAGFMLGKSCLDAGKTPPVWQITDPEFDLKAFIREMVH